TLHKRFIINAGSGFKMLWKAVKTFLDVRTVAKVQVLGSNYLSVLLDAIDIRVIAVVDVLSALDRVGLVAMVV
ncbi:hypothetical protein S83_051133, partial [Arachis hypogaea]